MDTRIALKNDTKLRFYNSSNGACEYTIRRELSRGASCIVYDASYVNNSGALKSVVIKECYPFALDMERSGNGAIVPASGDEKQFVLKKEKMRRAFDLGNELFDTEGLTNFTSNAVDIYEYNNTVYVVTAYQEGAVLSDKRLPSLKASVSVVKSIAKVIDKIHRKGYLYLDLKPENIFILAGTTELVQIFDFDSLVPISAFSGGGINECEYKISYTKGFSALELQMGNLKRIGKAADVYAIGAILFYLIFGTPPAAPDCSVDAEYDYRKNRFASNTFQDKMYYELTDFFRHTLADYYLDRYQDMRQAVLKLEEIEKLADTAAMYIQNSYFDFSKAVFGRGEELEALSGKLRAGSIVFVTGMGGIGKSTLVQKYLTDNVKEYDTVVFLKFQKSLKQTVADDGQFAINAVSQSAREDTDEYFARKLAAVRRLICGKRAVMVIDNFDGDDFDGLDEIIKTGLKTVIITRRDMAQSGYPCLAVGPIRKKDDMYAFFEKNLRRAIEPHEYAMAESIIKKVRGHTLVIELVAKQIANSFLTIGEAAVLMEEKGFSRIAPEKVSYEKDSVIYSDTARNIIDALFISSRVTTFKKSVLKGISLFGTAGIDVNMFASAYGLETKDVVNELVSEGWVGIENYKLTMHPVIAEAVRAFPVTDDFKKAAAHMMTELKKRLMKGKGKMLSLCEVFLERCKEEKGLARENAYRELLYEELCLMPRRREEYILDNAAALSRDAGNLSESAVVKLYGMITEIYGERYDFDNARAFLTLAKKAAAATSDSYVKGLYYYLAVGYYDYKLNGKYDPPGKSEARLLSSLIKNLDRAIFFMGRSKKPEARPLLAEYLCCKANMLIRSDPKEKAKISRLLKKAEAIISAEGMEYTELGCAYNLALAWYHAYCEPDKKAAGSYLKKAYASEIAVCEDDIDIIDNIYVPSANIMLECGDFKASESCLLQGMRLCEGKEEIVPYARKKKMLEDCLSDVYAYMENDKRAGT